MSWLRDLYVYITVCTHSYATLLCDQRGNNDKQVLSLVTGVYDIHETQPK